MRNCTCKSVASHRSVKSDLHRSGLFRFSFASLSISLRSSRDVLLKYMSLKLYISSIKLLYCTKCMALLSLRNNLLVLARRITAIVLWAKPFGHEKLKPCTNGVASRRKLKTWVYLRHRLARACVHLRWLAMTCAHFGRDQICTQV